MIARSAASSSTNSSAGAMSSVAITLTVIAFSVLGKYLQRNFEGRTQ